MSFMSFFIIGCATVGPDYLMKIKICKENPFPPFSHEDDNLKIDSEFGILIFTNKTEKFIEIMGGTLYYKDKTTNLFFTKFTLSPKTKHREWAYANFDKFMSEKRFKGTFDYGFAILYKVDGVPQTFYHIKNYPGNALWQPVNCDQVYYRYREYQ